MKILIIEDEALAAERLTDLIHRYDNTLQIIAVLPSVESAIAWFSSHSQPDLLLVDIQLSDGLCFEIFRTVQVTCPVIFTTSYDQYALEAFDVNSISYLLKPVKYQQLVNSLNKLEELKKTLGRQIDLPGIESIIKQLAAGPDKYKSRFLVKNGLNIRAVKTAEIAYFFSEQKISMLMTLAGQKFPVDYSLEEIEMMLNPDVFFRISRKFIVHIDAVKAIHPYFKGRLKVEVQPETQEEIIVSSDRTPGFKEWLDK
jgi:two-component system, LytTR family, response regulator LytT